MKKILLSVVLGLGMLASFAQTISNVSFSTLTPGEEATVTFDYTSDKDGWLRIIFGATVDAATNDFISWGDVYAASSWGSLKELPAGTFTSVTATFTVPAATPSSAFIQAENHELKATVRVQETADIIIAETWVIADVAAAANSGKINTVTIPASAIIGNKINIDLDYTHDFPTAQAVKILLEQAAKDGAILWGNGTFGYAEITLDAGTNVSKSIDFQIKTANDEQVSTETSASLAEGGNEWRIVIQFLGVETQKIIELNTAVVEPVIENVVDNIELSASSVEAGDSIKVNFDYSLAQNSTFEIYVSKFKGDTQVDPVVVVSDVTSSDEMTKSSSSDLTAADEFYIKIDADAIASDKLGSEESYKIVFNILDATSEAVVESFVTPITITSATGLFDFGKVELLNAFPNPASTTVNFTQRLTNVVVLDATGLEVVKINSATELNVSSYKAGIYLVKSEQGIAKVVVK